MLGMFHHRSNSQGALLLPPGSSQLGDPGLAMGMGVQSAPLGIPLGNLLPNSNSSGLLGAGLPPMANLLSAATPPLSSLLAPSGMPANLMTSLPMGGFAYGSQTPADQLWRQAMANAYAMSAAGIPMVGSCTHCNYHEPSMRHTHVAHTL